MRDIDIERMKAHGLREDDFKPSESEKDRIADLEDAIMILSEMLFAEVDE